MTVPQDIFRDALLNPQAAVPPGLVDGQGRDAGRRFNVYRNNVAVSLTEALRTGFPVITKLLGQQNMDGLAGLFLRAHPPSSPLMMHYGDAFPAFLADVEQLGHLPYLADVARLELAIRRSYHAADAAPIDPSILAKASPDDLMATTVTLAPSAELIRSSWPIHGIWRFNTEPDAPKPQAQPEDVLVTRAEFDPVPHPLPQGGGDWIAALIQGQTIGQAHDLAVRKTQNFDLGATLALMLQGGAITSLSKKD